MHLRPLPPRPPRPPLPPRLLLIKGLAVLHLKHLSLRPKFTFLHVGPGQSQSVSARWNDLGAPPRPCLLLIPLFQLWLGAASERGFHHTEDLNLDFYETFPARNRHINISKFFESCNFFCYIASFRRDKPICSLNQVCICRRFIVTTHFILKHNLPVNIKFA